MGEEPVVDAEEAEQPGALSVLTTATDGVLVISLAGEIDYDTGHQLQQALEPDPTARCAVVDLRQVAFIDSTGINVLLAGHRLFSQAGGWLRLAGPSESVLRTLKIVGLDRVIDCYPTLRDALNS